jgi:hypothetical protein
LVEGRQARRKWEEEEPALRPGVEGLATKVLAP